jgi:ABC-type transport system involved in multi-copper enzyme maturation permease subunit
MASPALPGAATLIRVVAGSTFREAVRSRTFLGLLVIFAVCVGLSRIVGWVSSTDGNVVTTDLVMSLQAIIGVLVAVATGTALVQSEITNKTLYTVISRPIARWQFVVGKYLGLAAGLALGQAAMLAIGLAYLAATGAEVHRWLLLAGLMTLVEVLVMAAVSLCWTALSSPLLAAVLGLATWFCGHAVASLPELINHLKGWQLLVAAGLASLVPNLGQFAYRNQAVYQLPLGWTDLGQRLGYGALWIALLVTLTVVVFRRKHL